MLHTAPDPWLAGVMSRPVHRVSGSVAPGEESDGMRALAHLDQNGFAYARIPTAEVRLAQLLEDAGFRLVDAGITLETDTKRADDRLRPNVRLARPEDVTATEAIARTAFRFSRFHLDPRIPTALANEIKAQWAGNFFRGTRGDYMVVAEHAGNLTGFLQLLAAPDRTLIIDLIAVTEAHREQGLASSMIGFAARECGAPPRLRVGTQAANVASLRLYERLGFTVTATSYVLHRHGRPA
jgi:ribosomal protein S18 acetylase RimI-like enzyme